LPVVAETLTYNSGMYGKELPGNFMHTFRVHLWGASHLFMMLQANLELVYTE